MNTNALKYYKIIGKLQSSVSKASSFDEAIQISLHAMLDNSAADYAVVWGANSNGKYLMPYYWLCPLDLTSYKVKPGKGIVGKTYSDSEPIIANGVSKIDKETLNMFEGIKIKSIVCVPFSSRHTNLGCIEFIKTSKAMTSEEADICQILSLLVESIIDENAPSPGFKKDNKVLMQVRGLKKAYKNGDVTTQVLKGVNFDVFDGEFLCFLGESGCGKSTVLNIIGGLDEADEGTFTFADKKISGLSQEELTKYRRDNIGFIFQSYNLMPNLTAKQNLDLIGELVENPMDSIEALKEVNLFDKRNNYPSQLSGGQQQRISIARALIKKPKLIMADEPTAALDYATSIEVLETMENVVKSGTTLVMVTHNEEITKMADRIIRFRDGKTYEITINRNPKKARELVW